MDEEGPLSATRCFHGDGEMASAVRRADWGATPLGPVAAWPPAIRTAVGICLNAQFPLMVLAGPGLACFYNDAAIALLGERHPSALGRPMSAVWPEAWDAIGAVPASVLATGRAARHDDCPLAGERAGLANETRLTLAYSAVLSDAGEAVGVFVGMMQTSGRCQPPQPHRGLTGREGEIVALIGAGMQIKQVAAELGISVSSVNTYRTRVFRKVGLSSNAALIRYALKSGLAA